MYTKIMEIVLDNSQIFKSKQRINICNQLTQHSKELIIMNKLFLNSKGELIKYDNKTKLYTEP